MKQKEKLIEEEEDELAKRLGTLGYSALYRDPEDEKED